MKKTVRAAVDRDKIINEYHKIYFRDTAAARKLIKKLDTDNNDHQLLQLIAQTYLDEARFTKDRRGKVPYDGQKLRCAERYIVKA